MPKKTAKSRKKQQKLSRSGCSGIDTADREMGVDKLILPDEMTNKKVHFLTNFYRILFVFGGIFADFWPKFAGGQARDDDVPGPVPQPQAAQRRLPRQSVRKIKKNKKSGRGKSIVGMPAALSGVHNRPIFFF